MGSIGLQDLKNALAFRRLYTISNTAVGAAANVIPAAAQPTLTQDCLIRVTVSENTGVVFSLSMTRAGVTTVMPFQAGVALVANGLYMFDFNARAGDTINFQFVGATTINVLNVDMVRTTGP